MRIKLFIFTLLILSPSLVWAMNPDAHDHPQVFHSFMLEGDIGQGQKTISRWDFSGWIGSDKNKLWLKSEGETINSKTDRAEFWALYSRNIESFWDIQTGIGSDTKPGSSNYFIFGLNGLAPYLFATEGYVFLNEKGNWSLRLKQTKDLLITQRLITEPYIELNLFAQEIKSKNVGSGLGHGDIGLKTRYEITRKFAPYLDLRFEKRFGQTANKTNQDEKINSFIISLGLRLRF